MAPKNTKTNIADGVTLSEEAVDKTEIAVEAAETPVFVDHKEAERQHFRKMRELVAVTPAPPRMGEDPNYPIGINGKLWLLPKGKTSQVPRYVAMAYNQAEAARGVQQDNQAKLLERQSGGTIDLSKMTEAQIAQLKTILGIG